MQAIERARLEDLLAQYWEIAFDESSGVTPTGNKANRVLHEIRALFNKLEDENQRLRAESEERLQNCAALVAENERLRKDAERKPMPEEDLLALFARVQPRLRFTDADIRPFASGVAAAEFFHGIKGTS